MAGVRRQESAFTRRLLERFVKRRRIKQWKLTNVKHGVVGNHAVMRDDVEGGRGQPPPRSGHFAIRHEAIVQYITIFFTFGPLSLEIKGVIGRQKSWPRDDLGGRSSVYIVEDSGFGSDVV